jgi:O-antigen/teichoic acid export membrane protein
MGVYALAQSLNQYLQPMIDFGLRHVGARLLALYPEAGHEIVVRIQRRRLWMAGAALPLLLIYSIFAKLPFDMKVFLFAFSAMGLMYAISLDWAAWGKGQLYLAGVARTAVPFSILMFLVVIKPVGTRVLWWAVGGNAFGFMLQAAIFWVWWKTQPSTPVVHAALSSIRASLAFRRTSIMGIAWLCNLAFNTIDILMLGLMSSPDQVGLYGAAYRILNQVLSTYYLFTYVLYPQFARHDLRDRARMLRPRILLPLAGTGILIAAIISASRRTLLTILFGHQFLASCPLLFLLAWSIPFDFTTSYLSNAFLAWGMEKKILVCTAIGAFSNVVLNLAFIPSYGARAAALNTLLSYAIFLISLVFVGRTVKKFALGAQPQMTAVACS